MEFIIFYYGHLELTRKCRKSIHSTKDPEYLTKGLNPTAMFYMSADDNLEPMTKALTSPSGGLEPMQRTHVSLFYGSTLGRPKGEQWKLESSCQQSEGAVLVR